MLLDVLRSAFGYSASFLAAEFFGCTLFLMIFFTLIRLWVLETDLDSLVRSSAWRSVEHVKEFAFIVDGSWAFAALASFCSVKFMFAPSICVDSCFGVAACATFCVRAWL